MRRQSPLVFLILGFLLGIFGLSAWNRLEWNGNAEMEELFGHSDEHDGGEEKRQFFGFQHKHEESRIVKQMRKDVRILCWIMTGPDNAAKALAVNSTWAPHCDKWIFVSASADSQLPTVDLNVTAGRQHLWEKTKRAFRYVFENFGDDFDWFLKADDDTFVIVENLRFMLLGYSPKDSVYFGCKFRPLVRQGYMSGGSGYVLSREALRRFVLEALPDPKKCKQSESGAEDAEMGKCLEAVGVMAGDSRDQDGRHRMLPLSPTAHFDVPMVANRSALPSWFHRYIYYSYDRNGECCSDYMISFHYVSRSSMFSLYNTIYHIRAFGVNDNAESRLDGNLSEAIGRMAKSAARPLPQI